MTRIYTRVPMEERFWKFVTPGDPDECWLWHRPGDPDGYGRIKDDSTTKTLRAHRVSYEMHVGPIPEGLCVLHRCDVRLCVNPDHLFLGTRKDNMVDAAIKGKMRGSLTPDEVLAIRANAGRMTIAEQARRLGVRWSVVSNVRSGRTFSYV